MVNQQATPEQLRRQEELRVQEEEALEAARVAAAEKALTDQIKKIIGTSVGHLEEQIRQLNISFNANGVTTKSIDNRLESLELQRMTQEEEGEVHPELTFTGDQKLRIRLGHALSIKGIHTYDGTVEGENIPLSTLEAIRVSVDGFMEKLQPIYADFVEPEVPGLTVVNRFEVPEEAAAETPETDK